MGESLKNLRKFLVRAPIGMVIPPSMKAIIGMTTSPVFLSSNHSPYAAYLTSLKSLREFSETYRFEKWSSDKVFVYVDAQESARERERQVQCTGSRIMRLLKVKKNLFESLFIVARKLRAGVFPLVFQENSSTVRFPSYR